MKTTRRHHRRYRNARQKKTRRNRKHYRRNTTQRKMKYYPFLYRSKMFGGNLPPILGGIESDAALAQQAVTRADDIQSANEAITMGNRGIPTDTAQIQKGGANSSGEQITVPHDNTVAQNLRTYGPNHPVSGVESSSELYGSTWQMLPHGNFIPFPPTH